MRILNRLGLLTAAVMLSAAGPGATAQAEFGVAPGAFTTTLSGTASGQAGAPAEFETGFELNRLNPAGPSPAPDGTIRNLNMDLPPGLLGNPNAVAPCTITQVTTGAIRCPTTSAVGVAQYRLYDPATGTAPTPRSARLYRVTTQGDEAAAFAFSALTIPIRLSVAVGPENGYRVRAKIVNQNEQQPLIRATVKLWGVPQDFQGPGPISELGVGTFGGPLADTVDRTRFLSTPTRCDGNPLTTSLTLASWRTGQWIPPVTADVPGVTGCDQLTFEPSISVEPDNRQAGQPSGYQVDVEIPQNEDPYGLETPSLKDAVVKLPAGVAISAPQADGLDACTDAQLGLNDDTDVACPDASKIGTVQIESPLLSEVVKGAIYVGSQQSQDPESGDMYRIFLTGRADGVRIKLRGSIKADAKTGQLTTSFLDNPQLPFSKMTLRFKDGARAPLVNPSACGTHTTDAEFVSWAGQSVDTTSSFVIDEGCPTGQFAPSLTAGTANPLAGGFSPFAMTVSRTDADQNLSALNMALPSGVLAALGSVPLCAEAQAAAGTCGPESRIGSTTVDVGSGESPYRLGGTVSVAGPYKGAPFSLSVAVPAKAGPFDLGLVVVRAALHVDANNAKVTAVTDPFPTIVGGVPVKMRTVNVSLDRAGFMFNATSCRPADIVGAFTSVGGATALAAVPYQAQGCDRLKLDPKLSMEYTGKDQMRKGKHPGIKARLGDMLGQSNLKQVKVTLPLTASLEPENARALCEAAEAAAKSCPAASQIGWAKATTPSLHVPVQGPVYFVKGTRVTEAGKVIPTLPKLYVKMSGEGVAVELHADSYVDDKKRLVTTFVNIPDVPVRDFELTINNGKSGIIEATNDVCGAAKGTVVEFVGHNGGVTERKLNLTAPACKPQVVNATNSRNSSLAVRVGGIGAGQLTLTGAGLGRTTRTIKSSDTALLRPKFNAKQRAALRQRKVVRTTLRIRYAPKQGKAVTFTKKIAVRGIRR